ncbi:MULTISPECIES: hypothetical protein [Kocuria]|uniref:Uncharacterized protein n=1 Tax=Kocuria subflava TaxID=1736139 RepID=A0A846U049_9MICC|nr:MULTISPECIES: hypothetical protein [Kocuria]NKE09885.1 hypothetical protein [Kocuria subflava]
MPGSTWVGPGEAIGGSIWTGAADDVSSGAVGVCEAAGEGRSSTAQAVAPPATGIPIANEAAASAQAGMPRRVDGPEIMRLIFLGWPQRR